MPHKLDNSAPSPPQFLQQRRTEGQRGRRVTGPAALALWAPGPVLSRSGLRFPFGKQRGGGGGLSDMNRQCQLHRFERGWRRAEGAPMSPPARPRRH